MAGRQKNDSVAFCVARLPSTQLLKACLAVYQSMHMLEQSGSYTLKKVLSALPKSRGGILEGSLELPTKEIQIHYDFPQHFDTFQYLCECEI